MSERAGGQRIEHLAEAPELERVKVLLVDDRTDDLNILRMTLDSPSYDLVTARSGAEALKKVLVDEYAVIVCDVLLPVMDGFEVAALIKQRERSKHTPILFLTAAGADMRFIYKAYAVGGVDFMTKPLEPDVLRAKVAIFADMFRKDLRIRRQGEALRAATERQKELELAELRRRTDERYRNLADASPSIVWTAGPGGELTYANRRWREYTGLGHDQWRGWGWLRAIHDDDVDRVETGWREAIHARREYTAECRVKRADGAYRWHIWYAMPEADAGGHVVGWVATMTDTEELRQSIQARDEFLAVASHELRTPLSTLGLAVHALRLAMNGGRPDPTRMLSKVEAAERQIERLDKLVAALLDVTRIVGRRVVLEPHDCDLAQLAREVMERARAEAEKAGCVLTLEAPAPVVGRWDPLRIDQVLTNLLSNALRHGAGRPVEIVVDVVDEEAARLVVRDHGEGIPREQMPLLFGRFQRGHGRTGQGGLGLGLFISRHIVEAHGGAIKVASEPGRGTTFTVELPTSESDGEQSAG